MPIHKVLVMGVAGCGKSTLAARVAHALDAECIEGDDHHPEASKAKMRQGIPLQNADREPWLTRLAALLAAVPGNAVLACSALKRSYREQLRAAVPQLRIVYVDITLSDAIARVASRADHMFPPSLVLSQFAILEPPAGEPGVLQIPADQPVDAQVQQVLRWIDEDPSRQDNDASQSQHV
ncbi:gluconokinase [Ralstonia solanacearum]|uniref:gluconokinase n=1 Tax=Ralstonia solanacearum TaxID=305 RepID=UPI001B3B3C1A|nr:gluconokinase [Ralstonia solanacearum]AST34835.2 gluconokinase [Ralstonia solanacearum]MDB0509638.1 gluconokinase [Ralstonia solanacearum]MDB0515570.1 gluconokinase [Ralstonia solanacearum]MDB0528800.1 gluconokinase [Ralstonia solanacearum]MDB0566853.1 gluconokinase [Ralstonia solanacearum]